MLLRRRRGQGSERRQLMASLMATLGLNTQSFHERLYKIRQESAKVGKQIQKNLNPAPDSGGEGGGHLKAGVLRESMVLIREISRGDWKRATSSASILLQRMGALGIIMNPITAAVIGLGAGFFAAWKFSSALVERLSGLKIPEINPEYIAKHLQKINQAAEAQKEINREVKKTEELYDSAAKTAERFGDVIKEGFDHQRKMNQYAEEKEMALARSEQQRRAIREKYADIELALNTRQRNEDVRKKKQGDAISVNSKEHDQQLLEQKKKMAEEGQKYLDELNSKGMTGKAKDALVRGFNKVALSGVSGADLDKAEADNKAEAYRRIQAFKDQVDSNAGNDELRKRKEELYKGAGESASKAAELGKAIPDLIRMYNLKGHDDALEAQAKLDAENAKGLKHSVARPDVNALQKIGAYAAIQDPKTELARKSEKHLRGIHENIKAIAHRNGRGVKFA